MTGTQIRYFSARNFGRAALAVLLSLAMLASPGATWAQEAAASSALTLNIVIVEGEGAVNNIRQRVAREPIVRVGDLSPARDFTDVRDVVRAYALLLETARAGEVFNICQGVPVRMEVILNTLIRLSRVPITVTVDAARLRPSDIPMLYGDSTALRACTGWQPVYTLEQSLSDILNQWRKFHTTQETQ